MRYSRWWPDLNIRLFKKGHVEWSEIIHSVPTTTGKGLDLEATEKNALVHYHYVSIEQYITRLNRYTTVQDTRMVYTDLHFLFCNRFLSWFCISKCGNTKSLKSRSTRLVTRYLR